MERKKYYVNIGNGEISQTKVGNNDQFVIYATDEEVMLLRARMDDMDDASFRSFFRAHVPILPYHHDQPNDDYDSGLTEAFRKIYELGDEETKQHIEEIGVLGDNHL